MLKSVMSLDCLTLLLALMICAWAPQEIVEVWLGQRFLPTWFDKVLPCGYCPVQSGWKSKELEIIATGSLL